MFDFPEVGLKHLFFRLGFYMEVHPPGLPMIHHPIVRDFIPLEGKAKGVAAGCSHSLVPWIWMFPKNAGDG